LAEPNEKGEWVCVAIGNCKIEELNKRKMLVPELQHKDVQAFIQKDDND
jgi:hypothetical protein